MSKNPLSWYREFVYLCGGVEQQGKARISKDRVDTVRMYHGKLGLGDIFRYRVRNISEGLCIGSYDFIADIQKRFKRKFIRPRSFLSGNFLYSTRVLRQ